MVQQKTKTLSVPQRTVASRGDGFRLSNALTLGLPTRQESNYQKAHLPGQLIDSDDDELPDKLPDDLPENHEIITPPSKPTLVVSEYELANSSTTELYPTLRRKGDADTHTFGFTVNGQAEITSWQPDRCAFSSEVKKLAIPTEKIKGAKVSLTIEGRVVPDKDLQFIINPTMTLSAENTDKHERLTVLPPGTLTLAIDGTTYTVGTKLERTKPSTQYLINISPVPSPRSSPQPSPYSFSTYRTSLSPNQNTPHLFSSHRATVHQKPTPKRGEEIVYDNAHLLGADDDETEKPEHPDALALNNSTNTRRHTKRLSGNNEDPTYSLASGGLLTTPVTVPSTLRPSFPMAHRELPAPPAPLRGEERRKQEEKVKEQKLLDEIKEYYKNHPETSSTYEKFGFTINEEGIVTSVEPNALFLKNLNCVTLPSQKDEDYQYKEESLVGKKVHLYGPESHPNKIIEDSEAVRTILARATHIKTIIFRPSRTRTDKETYNTLYFRDPVPALTDAMPTLPEISSLPENVTPIPVRTAYQTFGFLVDDKGIVIHVDPRAKLLKRMTQTIEKKGKMIEVEVNVKVKPDDLIGKKVRISNATYKGNPIVNEPLIRKLLFFADTIEVVEFRIPHENNATYTVRNLEKELSRNESYKEQSVKQLFPSRPSSTLSSRDHSSSPSTLLKDSSLFTSRKHAELDTDNSFGFIVSNEGKVKAVDPGATFLTSDKAQVLDPETLKGRFVSLTLSTGSKVEKPSAIREALHNENTLLEVQFLPSKLGEKTYTCSNLFQEKAKDSAYRMDVRIEKENFKRTTSLISQKDSAISITSC